MKKLTMMVALIVVAAGSGCSQKSKGGGCYTIESQYCADVDILIADMGKCYNGINFKDFAALSIANDLGLDEAEAKRLANGLTEQKLDKVERCANAVEGKYCAPIETGRCYGGVDYGIYMR